MAALKKSGWHRYTLTSSFAGQVSFDVAVVCQNLKNSRHKKKGRDALIYVTFLVKHHSFSFLKQTYRHSEGIESSYRQLNQARIKTSTQNPALRLLFYAIALILRLASCPNHSNTKTRFQPIQSNAAMLSKTIAVAFI